MVAVNYNLYAPPIRLQQTQEDHQNHQTRRDLFARRL
jgi:hypothetical protein